MSEIDNQNVRQWIDGQISQLFALEEPKQAAQDAYKLFFNDNGLVRHFKSDDAVEEFRQALAEMVIELVAEKYQAQPTNPTTRKPVPMVYALLALEEFASPRALDLFNAALSDPASGVRALSAEGLQVVADKLSDEQRSGLYESAGKALRAEKSSPVAVRLFRLLVSLKSGGQADELLPVAREILDLRLNRCEQEEVFPSRAEQVIASWIVDRIKGTNNQQTKKEVVLLVARLLADAVYTYLYQSPVDLDKIKLKLLVASTEKKLQSFVSGGSLPNLSSAVAAEEEEEDREKKEEKRQKIAVELGKWIGTEQQDGLLNQAPFELPRRLGIERTPEVEPSTTSPVGEPSNS